MAKKALYTHLVIDDNELSSQTTSLEMDTGVDSADSTTFQATAAQFTMLNPTPKMSVKGLLTTVGDGNMEKEFYDRIGTQTTTVAGLFGTDTAACPAYVIPSAGAEGLKYNAPAAGLLELEGSFVGSNMYRGLRILHTTISATGAQTGVDFAAAGSAGGKAWLFVTAKTGTITGADIDIESDSDSGFGTAASEGTFTFSALGAFEISLSGTIGRYIRANVTDLGGATDFDVVIIVAVSGVTY